MTDNQYYYENQYSSVPEPSGGGSDTNEYPMA